MESFISYFNPHDFSVDLSSVPQLQTCVSMRFMQSSFKLSKVIDVANSQFQADVDNSGTIDYGEFIAATVHLNKLEREEHLMAAFQYFDKDGSGYITVDEVQQACIEHNMTDVYFEDIIREVDQDNVSPLF